MNICGCGSLSSPLLVMSATTPTICRSAFGRELAHDALADDEALVERIALRPELLGHRLVDDDDRRATWRVSRSLNVASALHRDLEHLEVARRHRHPAAAAVERALAVGRERPPDDAERQAVAALQRHAARRARARRRRGSPSASRRRCAPACSTASAFSNCAALQRHLHRQHVVRVEARDRRARAPSRCG